jgi:hypothetical protein
MENNVISIISDAINYVQKVRVASQVRQAHLAKQNKKCDITERIYGRAADFEKWLENELSKEVKNHPAYDWFSQVKGIGNINIGKVICHIDIEKASTISKLWRFAGFGVINGCAEKRKKGEKLHFNKELKTMCWRLGKSLIRAKGKYYDFYISEKKKLIEKALAKGKKVVSAAELPKKNGKRLEDNEHISIGHIDMMAMRKMIKLFLAHLWLKWREAEGLSITEPYSIGLQNHSGYISPDEMVG